MASGRRRVGPAHTVYVIDAVSGREWRRVDYPGKPRELQVSVKLERTLDGYAVAGVQVERTDGHALTIRGLRTVRFPPEWHLAGEAPARWFGTGDDVPVLRPAKKGPRGKSEEHWRAVWLKLRQAEEVSPRAPARWMLGQWPEVSDATMRRWIKRARERAQALGWDRDAVPQKADDFTQQDETPPAGTPAGDTPDSA